eukprot:CAMPEP_0174383438 /NCGR_PEP_ID=MMETSP0811_2-20130205/125232_1 /TAXON_ID=73025 ORGANISM="Eutreptiella gymnastica-like, Strain CCMP1594" /NCGR_SAMPLE_ID=MMETSP0811_2 /ASSEMBLY_ACC=CAM_ASM_000667 /LENGTH=56 /DNA_ID=CAMNT_0015537021 /DNA_START=88 /DNA_END=259 /DNA_ORIENTATION=+
MKKGEVNEKGGARDSSPIGADWQAEPKTIYSSHKAAGDDDDLLAGSAPGMSTCPVF